MRSLILVVAPSLLLAACGGNDIADRKRPDEFAVGKQAPLVIPPDFALTPPAPGAPRPSDRNTATQAQDALFGAPAPRSEVEKNAGNRAGTAANSIRSTVGDPLTNTVAKGSVTRDIIAAPQGDGREAQVQIGG